MSDNGFESALSSVLGNEELMKKISLAVEGKGGDKEASRPEVIDLISSSFKKDGKDKSEGQDSATEASSVIGGKEKSGFNIPSFSKNADLLCALKPYLSEKRVAMLDNILKIEQIAEIMKITR